MVAQSMLHGGLGVSSGAKIKLVIFDHLDVGQAEALGSVAVVNSPRKLGLTLVQSRESV